jgi:hypothetical protein
MIMVTFGLALVAFIVMIERSLPTLNHIHFDNNWYGQ